MRLQTEKETEPLEVLLKRANEQALAKNEPQQSPLTAEELAKLEGMSREELLALVERMARQCGLVATISRDETAQAMRDVLAEIALRPIIASLNLKADIQLKMNAIDRWLDRTEGRAKQQIELTGKDGEPLSVRLLAVQERLLKDVTPVAVLQNLP